MGSAFNGFAKSDLIVFSVWIWLDFHPKSMWLKHATLTIFYHSIKGNQWRNTPASTGWLCASHSPQSTFSETRVAKASFSWCWETSAGQPLASGPTAMRWLSPMLASSPWMCVLLWSGRLTNHPHSKRVLQSCCRRNGQTNADGLSCLPSTCTPLP